MSGSREEILEAAGLLFSRKGIAETTVREIAAASGQNIALVSYYFGSKEGLVEAVVQGFMEAFREKIPPRSENLEPSQRAVQIIDLLCTAIRENEHSWKVTFRLLLDDSTESRAVLKRQLLATIMATFGLDIHSVSGEMAPGLPWFISGPALSSMVFSHFLFKPLIREIGGFEPDDRFYERYRRSLGLLFTQGLKGFEEEEHRNA